MKHHSLLSFFIFFTSVIICLISINCSKAITEPEVEGITLTYRVVSYNSIPIEERPAELIIPIEIRLIDYRKGEKLQADVRFSKLGWISSSDRFNDINEIYVEIKELGPFGNITLAALVITESNLTGVYFWGMTDSEKTKFVAVKK